MSQISQNWLSGNELRAYPVNEAASRSYNGSILPDDILVDANIWIPSTLGKRLYLSSVGLSPKLVSLTFCASDTDHLQPVPPTPSFKPAASIHLVKPVVPYKNYPLTALTPGVGGWVSFGTGVLKDYLLNFIFAGPAEGLMVDRAVRIYNPPKVTSIGKLNVGTLLKGLVTLQGGPGQVVTAAAQRSIDSLVKTVLTIGLDPGSDNSQTLLSFANTCGHRPSAKTCSKTPISQIENVMPDCAGNIDIIFEDDTVVGDTGTGIILDSPIGLSTLCPKDAFNVDSESRGDCVPPFPSSSSTPSSSSHSHHSSFVPPISSSGGANCGIIEDFEAGAGHFSPISGSWSVVPSGGGHVYEVAGHGPFSRVSINTKCRPSVLAGFVLEGIVHPLSGVYDGHLIFGYASPTSYFTFGVLLNHTDHPYGCFYIGRKSGQSGVGGGSNGPGPSGSQYLFLDPVASVFGITNPAHALQPRDYSLKMKAQKVGSLVIVQYEATWNDGSGQSTGVQSASFAYNGSFWVPARHDKGRVGLGSVESFTDFDAFGLNASSFP